MWSNPQKTADLVTSTEEILNGKLHFLCNAFGSEYASGSEYARVLNILVFWICKGYAGSEYAWICLNNSWIFLNIPEYAWICLNLAELLLLCTSPLPSLVYLNAWLQKIEVWGNIRRGKVKFESRVTSFEFKSTSYEFKFTRYEFKSTS